MDRFITALARLTAMAGGLVLTGLIVMVCVSISGRAMSGLGVSISGRAMSDLGLGPVPGDFELLEAGIAFAIFAFLPWCSASGGHATVDIFTNGLPLRENRWLLALWDVVMAIAVALIAWRLYHGMSDKLRYGETTLLLQFPIWWAYAACLVPAGVTVLVSFWSAFDRIRAVATGHDTRPVKAEIQH